jgi:hypothetical protein
MERRRVRIGDVIDDYCTRCRLIMNHGVVGMVDEVVRKVRCNTCMSEHVYKHGKVPARKRRENEKLFAEVLRGLGREPGEPGTDEAVDADPNGLPPGSADAADEDAPQAPGDPAAAAAGPADTAPGGDPDAPGTGATVGDGGADRPAEHDHGVRRKLYTIRRFSGGKPPAGGGHTGGGHTGGGRPGGRTRR